MNVITGAGLPNSNPGLTDTITCNNSTSQLNGSSSSTGVSFDWTGPNGFTSSSATPTISDSGIYVLTVSFISTGCSSTSQVYIAMDTLSPNASITSSGNTISCDTTILSLTGASSNFGVNISWSNFAGAIVGNPINITASGTYSLTVTNGYTGCKNVQVFNVFANNTPPIISLSATADTLNCANTSTLLFSSSSTLASLFSWVGPNGFTSSASNPTTQINIGGDYIVTVIDTSNGCISSDTLTIFIGTDPVASFNQNPTLGTLPLPVNFTNTSLAGTPVSSSFGSYNWYFGDGSTSSLVDPAYTYTTAGIYTVTMIAVSSSPACNDTTYGIVTVYPVSTIEIPNIFTPNLDGINEIFLIKSTGLAELSVKIYSRWGLFLYELVGINDFWDGEGYPEGTYFFLLKAKALGSGDLIEKEGYFMLAR